MSKPRKSPKQAAGLAVITAAGRAGATQKDVRLALKINANCTSAALIDWRSKGLIWSSGTHMLMRHFAQPDWADDWARICVQVRDRARIERKKAKQAYEKVRREAHREEERERNRLWREANRERILADQRARYQAHKDELKAKRDAKKAAARAALPKLTKAQWVGTVSTKKPGKVAFKDQDAVIPSHVRVKVLPGYERFGSPFRARCLLEQS